MSLSKQGYISTNDGAKIYYQSYHSEASEVILLVHGFQCSSQFFYKNIEELSKKYHVVLMDLREHGQSSKGCENLSLKRMGMDINELIEQLQLNNVNLFGWSMGGNVVMEYYKQFGLIHFASIGLIDSRLYPYSDGDWNTHSCKGFNAAAANSRKERMLSDYQGYCCSLVDRYYVHLPEQKEKDFVIDELLKTDGTMMWKIYEDFLADDCYSALKNIELPVLVIATRHIGDDTGRHYTAVAQNSYYKYFTCGHCMMLENPELFNHVLVEFIKEKVAE